MLRWSHSRNTATKPRLPDDVRVYVLTDIHGCSDLLRSMFKVIDLDLLTIGKRRAIHVFLGDYIDRGPDSSGTIELLIERARKHETVFLKGNHEVFLLEALKKPELLRNWGQYGGLQTLRSYGVQPKLNPTAEEQKELIGQLSAAIPKHHRFFFDRLSTSFVCGDFFFVHAGIKPGLPLVHQREEDLLWIRKEFLFSERKHEKYIIHGHTPVQEPDIRFNRANIDTGAYATGNLTLLTIQGSQLLAL